MDVDFIFQVAGIGIIVAVLNQLLVRSGREEQAMLTTLAGLIVVLVMVVSEIGNLFEFGTRSDCCRRRFGRSIRE